MTVDTSLVISMDRTGMAGDPEPLVWYGTRGTGSYGITDYTEPAEVPQNLYATKSDYEDGQEPRGATMLNTLLGWDFTTDVAASENASRLLIAEVRLAIRRLRYAVTVTTAGASPEVWLVRGYGSLTPAGSRTYADLKRHNPEWSLSLPINPNRTIT